MWVAPQPVWRDDPPAPSAGRTMPLVLLARDCHVGGRWEPGALSNVPAASVSNRTGPLRERGWGRPSEEGSDADPVPLPTTDAATPIPPASSQPASDGARGNGAPGGPTSAVAELLPLRPAADPSHGPLGGRDR